MFQCFEHYLNGPFSVHLWNGFGKITVNSPFSQVTSCGRTHAELLFLVFCRIFEFRKIIGDREKCRLLVPQDYPVYINKVPVLLSLLVSLMGLFLNKYLSSSLFQTEENSDCYIHEGYFISPLEHFVPGILPPEAVRARWNHDITPHPLLHLALRPGSRVSNGWLLGC